MAQIQSGECCEQLLIFRSSNSYEVNYLKTCLDQNCSQEWRLFPCMGAVPDKAYIAGLKGWQKWPSSTL